MSSLVMSVYSTGPLACDEDFLANEFNDLIEGGEQPIETPATALGQSFVAKQKYDSISPQALASWDDMTPSVTNISACRSTIIPPAAVPPVVHSSSSASPSVSIPHQVDPVAAIVAQAQRREIVKRENAKVRQARMKAATHFPQDTPTSYNQCRHLDSTEISTIPFHHQYASSCQPLFPCRPQQPQPPTQSQYQQPQLPTQYEIPKYPAQPQQSIEHSKDFMPQTIYISSAPRQPLSPHAASNPPCSAPNASQDPNDVIIDLLCQTAKQKALRLEAGRVEEERIGAGHRRQPVLSEVQMKQVPVLTYVPVGRDAMGWGGNVEVVHESQHEPVAAKYKPIRPLSPELEPAPDPEKSIENEEEKEEPLRRPIAPLPKRRIRPAVGVVCPIQPLEPEPAPEPEEREEIDLEPEEETGSAMRPIAPLPKRRVRLASGVIVPTVPMPALVAPALATTVDASPSQQQETLQRSSSVDARRALELLELSSSPPSSPPSPSSSSSSSMSTARSTPPTSAPPSPPCSRPCTPTQVLQSIENTLRCAHPSAPTSPTPPCTLISSTPPRTPTSSSLPPGSNSTSTWRKLSVDGVTPREWKARSVSVYEEMVSRPSSDEVIFRASSGRGSSSPLAASRGSSSSRDSPPSWSLVQGTTTKLPLGLTASWSSAAKNRRRQMMGFQDRLVGMKEKEKEKEVEKEESQPQSTPLNPQSTQQKNKGKGKADKDNTKEKATPKGGRWRSTFVPVPSTSPEEEDCPLPSTPLHRVAPRTIRPSSTVKSEEGTGSVASNVLATSPSASMGHSTTPKTTPPVRKASVATSSTQAVSSSIFWGMSTTPKAPAPTSLIPAVGRSVPTTLAGTAAMPSVVGITLVTSKIPPKAPAPVSSIQASSSSMLAGLAATSLATTPSLFETRSTTPKASVPISSIQADSPSVCGGLSAKPLATTPSVFGSRSTTHKTSPPVKKGASAFPVPALASKVPALPHHSIPGLIYSITPSPAAPDPSRACNTRCSSSPQLVCASSDKKEKPKADLGKRNVRSVQGKIAKKDLKGKKAAESVDVPQIDEAPTASFADLPTTPDEINKMLANAFVDVDVEMDLFADLAVGRELDAEGEVDMDVDMGVDRIMSEVNDVKVDAAKCVGYVEVSIAGPKVPSTILTVEPAALRARPGAPSKKISSPPAKIGSLTGTGTSIKKCSSGFDLALTVPEPMEDDYINDDTDMEADEIPPGRIEVTDMEVKDTEAVMNEKKTAKPTSADLVPDSCIGSTLFGSVVSAVLSEAFKEVTLPSICDYPMDIDNPEAEIPVPVPQSPPSSTIHLVPGSYHALDELAVALSVLHLSEEQEKIKDEKGHIPVRGSTIAASVKVSPSSTAARFVPSHIVFPKRHSVKPSIKAMNFASEQQAIGTYTPAEKEDEIQAEEWERRSSRTRFLPDFGRAESHVVGNGCSCLRGRKLNALAVVPSPPYKTGRYFPAPGSSEPPPRTPPVLRKVAEKKIIGKELLWDHTLSPSPISKQEDVPTLPMRNHKPRRSKEGRRERKERKKALKTQRATDSQVFVQTLDIFDAKQNDLEHDGGSVAIL